MTNSEQAIREIARKHGIGEYSYRPVFLTSADKSFIPDPEFLSDLTALISEHYYPKEFLLWTHSQDYWLFDSLTCLWVSDEPSAFQEEKTTDELFNYWKENER